MLRRFRRGLFSVFGLFIGQALLVGGLEASAESPQTPDSPTSAEAAEATASPFASELLQLDQQEGESQTIPPQDPADLWLGSPSLQIFEGLERAESYEGEAEVHEKSREATAAVPWWRKAAQERKRIALLRKVWIARKLKEITELREAAEGWRAKSRGLQGAERRQAIRFARYAVNRARSLEQALEEAWLEWGEEALRGAENLDRAGDPEAAVECLLQAAGIFDPAGLKPWLSEFRPGDSPMEDGERRERVAKILRRAADISDRVGERERARRLRAEADRQIQRAADDYELTAEEYEARGWFDLAESLRRRAAALRQ